MDLLNFVSNVIGEQAWPAVAIFVVLFVARKAPSMAPYIKAVRYKEVEVTLREVRESVATALPDLGNSKTEETEPTDKILQLAEIDTGVAIAEVWKPLEAHIIGLIQHNGLVRFTRPDTFMKVLFERGKITSEELQLFDQLRKIRNESVHATTDVAPTVAEVIEYREFVRAFISRLDQIRSEPGYIDVAPPNK